MKLNFRNLFKPKSVANTPNAVSAEAKFKEGFALHQSGQLPQAQAIYEQALQMQASHFDALHLLGVIAYQRKDHLLAITLIEKAIALNPNNAVFYSNRGLAQQELKRFDEALSSYDQAIKLRADFAEAYYNRGNALKALNRLDEALASYDQAIMFKADFAGAFNNRGVMLHELKRWDEAMASYDHAISLSANYAEAYSNRGATLQVLKRWDEAVASYDHAISLSANYAEAYSNRGLALYALRRSDEALASYDQAITLKADYAQAHCNRGITLRGLKRFDDALASYDRAIQLNPDYADAYNNRGAMLQEIKRLDEALASCDQAIKLNADHIEAHISRGNVLTDLKRLDEALSSYEHALKIQSNHDFLYGTYLHTKMKLCNWLDVENQTAELIEKIRRNVKASPSFAVIALTSNPSIQRKAVEIWANQMHPVNHVFPAIAKRPRHKKIRVGYYSADFRNHPVSFLMSGVFEMHDKSRFECTAFSYGPDTKDDMRKRVERAFENFVDVRNEPDKKVALLSRNLEIDIAVDLGGFTQDARPGTFAMRSAPIQVSYIGYLGTMGVNYIDYLIADKTIIPKEYQSQYSEKIVHLPSYQANDSTLAISERRFTRKEIGLPDTGFVFCCFNNNYKITPATFDGWMRILKQVEGSVLLLYADNEWASANLKREAVSRGMAADRLVFGKRMPHAEHLARYRVADLFLDTLPCNAGTTASDALWAGLPVLTCTGEAFASRMAASLLNAIDLPELITTTQEQYEALAVELATKTAKLSHIKQKLERNRLTAPLFDTALFTKHIEAAYTQMYERYHADLLPDHIYVTP